MVLGRERERVNIAAADLNNLQLTFEQEVLEDTKLWLEVEVKENRLNKNKSFSFYELTEHW